MVVSHDVVLTHAAPGAGTERNEGVVVPLGCPLWQMVIRVVHIRVWPVLLQAMCSNCGHYNGGAFGDGDVHGDCKRRRDCVTEPV